MKQRILFFTMLLLPFIGLQAQITGNKHSFQVNPVDAVLFGSIDLQYERAITDRTTLSLTLGLKPTGGLFKIKGFDSPTMKTNDFEFTGFTFTPEYRWYFQRGLRNERTGLYLGGYYRYRSFNNEMKGTYTSSITKTSAPLDVDMSLRTHSFGAMFGYKVMIGKGFYCDILILGLGYTNATIKMREQKPLPAEFYVDASEKIIDNLDLVAEIVENVDIEEVSEKKGKGKFGLPSFRYGFKIGYTF